MSFLDRENTVAPPSYNRWLVPPAALAIHMCIGQVYGFSVFKLPLTRLLGVTQSGRGDWTQEQIAWIFSIAIAVLGLSAAFLGTWAERMGPRKVSFLAAFCFGGGFLVAALGVRAHSLALLYLGYGLLGGIGLGLGYIAPVSTLVKWFPDRPGLASGLAIMGFGGGAMIGSPLSVLLMTHFHTVANVGVASTFVVMGMIYFCFILFGAMIIRVPAPGWVPAGADLANQKKRIHPIEVTTAEAMRAPQFYLLWLVLLCNTTAGIGILEQAAPMIQEVFPKQFPQLPTGAKLASAAAAAGFVGLISLFNLLGRFFWASSSDFVGRKNTVAIFLGLNAIMFWLIPVAAAQGSVLFFVAVCALILSIYGGGFSTSPAYLKDLFGVKNFGPIYGRLLTAWSTAGVIGPLLVNHIRLQKVAQKITGIGVYADTMHLMAGLLVVAFLGNLCVRPVVARGAAAGLEPA